MTERVGTGYVHREERTGVSAPAEYVPKFTHEGCG